MSSLNTRLPSGTIVRGLSQLGRCDVPRLVLSTFGALHASSLKSTASCRGHAGLAHAPVKDAPIYRDIGRVHSITTPAPILTLHPKPLHKAPKLESDLKSTQPTTNIDIEGSIGSNGQASIEAEALPAYHRGTKFDREPYWQKIGRWKDVPEQDFLSYSWNTGKDVTGKFKLFKFLVEVLPENIPIPKQPGQTMSREAFIKDVTDGIAIAPMSIRLTPHMLASIDWSDPLGDPLGRQFIPKRSTYESNHPKVTLDPLHEYEDSPCEGLVHRYPSKVLLLASSHCPLYCRYCTRSYAVGANTETVEKKSLKPTMARWNTMLDYIATTPVIEDVVVSGGDSYSLTGTQLRMIGDRLLSIPHVRRFRVATKGLCTSPSRTLDPHDDWTAELIRLSRIGRTRGVHVALHTHFNHPNEFSWVTREAAQRLHEEAVVVRNQSVLLRGVNDNVEVMGKLIKELADNNIIPYYVYAGDMVKDVEDLRTPLQSILDLECHFRGSIAGFMTPQFVVDLPGGGGKRLATSYRSYDRRTGVSTFVAPAVKGKGKEDRVYEYYDPLHSLAEEERDLWVKGDNVDETQKSASGCGV